MDSINEQFRQVYNSQYKLEPYSAKKTPFSPQEYFQFAKKQHEILVATPTAPTAVIFLVREITHRVLERYNKVAEHLSQPVYLVTDKFWPTHKEGRLNIIYFYENIVYEAGYFYINTDVMPDKLVITWDRCLFFLSQYPGICEYAWIIEDDVAIRGQDTLARFFENFVSSRADLLAAPPKVNENDPGEWPLWAALRNAGFPTLWASYNPVTRMSRKMVAAIAEFVKEKRRLFFLEIFFVSLAMSKGLDIQYYKDLEEHFRYTPEITFDETQKSWKYPIFHPVKNWDMWDAIWASSSGPSRSENRLS